jgi:protoporphyrinogen/coproporphyrinogen III oxidase
MSSISSTTRRSWILSVRDEMPGAQLPDTRPVVAVVGAGISGLTAAWRLATGPEPPRVVVLEQSRRVGGKLLVGSVGDVEVDLGAESVLARRPEAVDLLDDVGLGDDVVHPATASAAVVRDRRVYPLPTGTVLGVPGRPDALAEVLTPAEVERVAADSALPAPPIEHDVDVASYVAGRVGRAVVDRLVEPLLGGVYAGSADRLSLQATAPQLWHLAQAGGSLLAGVRGITDGEGAPGPVFAGVRGGVGRLAQRLAAHLADLGVEIRTGVTVRGMERRDGGWRLVTGPAPVPEVVEADAVVLAVPPAPAARLLRAEVPAAAAELARVETASVALVAALLPRPALAGLGGSGVLVPPVEGRAVKAVTFASSKWAWLDALDPGHVVVRASLGRAREEAVLQRDDDDLAALALADLAALLGRELRPVAARVVRWGGALPQPAVGHVEAMRRMEAAVAAVPGLAVCGAVVDGVGIPACIAAAGRAAARVADLLGVVPATGGRRAAGRVAGGQ